MMTMLEYLESRGVPIAPEVLAGETPLAWRPGKWHPEAHSVHLPDDDHEPPAQQPKPKREKPPMCECGHPAPAHNDGVDCRAKNCGCANFRALATPPDTGTP